MSYCNTDGSDIKAGFILKNCLPVIWLGNIVPSSAKEKINKLNFKRKKNYE